jgi:hypothetical protein
MQAEQFENFFAKLVELNQSIDEGMILQNYK